ncbi:WD40/YVTN/BNR-like repeat-containing protein [Symbiobacterium terraclitae]|uniref:WD40/YVTN/BNR-like repeat-containing protein n=1 Tax=Symbiobacterium terraclitae TaxID=557451 RepID=UPI0035B55358
MWFSRRRSARVALMLLAALLAGCAGAPAASSLPDPPAPAGEPAGRMTEGRAALRPPAVEAVGADRVWVGGDGFILGSADGGATWREQWRGDGQVRELRFLDARTGWALTDQGVMATADGETWAVVGDQALADLFVLDAATLYGIAPEGLVVSGDGGRTWAVIPGTQGTVAACFAGRTAGWVTDGRTLRRTRDGGAAWTELAGLPTRQRAAESEARTPAAAPAPAPVPAPTIPPTREEVRERILRELNDNRTTLEQHLNFLAGRADRDDEVPWLAADLDADGSDEYVLALEVQDNNPWGTGAALFVLYRQGDAWQVDYSEPMAPEVEGELMAPHLHAAADLTGSGRPQIVWFRREMIATGPQPHFVFVTAWEPGRFSHLPGTMALSNARVSLDGSDVVLTGISRSNSYLPVSERTDRYRYVDGEFRLVDRRFTEQPEDGYARLWDGLVAESVGRVEDALTAYREAMDPDRPAHSGVIRRYKSPPRVLTDEETARFAPA